ncbi:MAG: 5'-methylthioadenosine/adenosylhomocysteine nucleosidase [Erysipelotrichaceae bacterium]
MIGIIAAMQIECDELLKLMQDIKKTEIHELNFYEGTLNKKQVVLMLSGVGKVNATMSTTILLDRYDISQIINIGTAGGLSVEQEVLDLVISDQVVQYDYDTTPIDGEAGRGKIFSIDQNLLNKVKNVLSVEACNLFVGGIASGDAFVSENAKIDEILYYFPNVICAEMEAGAIGQVCNHFKIPFIVIRSLSDIAHKEASQMDFLTYASLASKRSALFTAKIVEVL